MKIITEIPSDIFQNSAVTVGFFDGVHKGHVALLSRLKREATLRHLQSVVVTFRAHPRETLQTSYIPQLLNTQKDRLSLLEKQGVDICVMLPFTKKFAQLTSTEFIKEILFEALHTKYLLVGYDHHFGSDAQKNSFETYKSYGNTLGIEVEEEGAYWENNVCISSSLIRREILQGNITAVSDYLGYNYFLEGTVVKGFQIGRTIGFPTANLKISDMHLLIPMDGVYAVFVEIKGKKYKGMANIGSRPTFNENNEKTIEVNILEFNQNIYEQQIKVYFIAFLRKEVKFTSKEALTIQLSSDREKVRKILVN